MQSETTCPAKQAIHSCYEMFPFYKVDSSAVSGNSSAVSGNSSAVSDKLESDFEVETFKTAGKDSPNPREVFIPSIGAFYNMDQASALATSLKLAVARGKISGQISANSKIPNKISGFDMYTELMQNCVRPVVIEWLQHILALHSTNIMPHMLEKNYMMACFYHPEVLNKCLGWIQSQKKSAQPPPIFCENVEEIPYEFSITGNIKNDQIEFINFKIAILKIVDMVEEHHANVCHWLEKLCS